MRKTANIAAIATVLTLLLEHFIGMSEELGIEPQTASWIKFSVVGIVLILNVFTNVKSGKEIKELKSEKLK